MITHTQYGFKPGSTTVECLADLIEEISTCLDEGNYAVSIFGFTLGTKSVLA